MHTPLRNLPFSKLTLSFSPTTPRLPDHQRDHLSNFRGDTWSWVGHVSLELNVRGGQLVRGDLWSSDNVKALDDDPETLDISQMEHQRESVKGSDASYLKVHDEISELYPDKVNEEEEAFILKQHEDAVNKTLSLIIRLIDIRTLHMKATNLDLQLEDLETTSEATPCKNYSGAVQESKEELKDLQEALIRSTIPPLTT